MSGRDLPLAVLGCSLDASEAARQGERWDTLLTSVRRVDRAPRQIVAEFGAGVDEPLLLEAVEVERGCCPFFEIDWDGDRRQLRFAVREGEHAPALDAVADAFSSTP